MTRTKWILFAASAALLCLAGGLGYSIWGGPTPVSANGSTTAAWGYIATFIASLTGGAGLSAPAIWAMIQKLIPSLSGIGGIAVDPRIAKVFSAVKISMYLYLIDQAGTSEAAASMIEAGRRECDSIRDQLFPLSPVPAPVIAPNPPVTGAGGAA